MQRRLQDDNDHQRLRASEQTIIVGGPAQGREAALSTTGAGWRGRSHSIETRVEGSSKLRTDLLTAHTLWMIRLDRRAALGLTGRTLHRSASRRVK